MRNILRCLPLLLIAGLLVSAPPGSATVGDGDATCRLPLLGAYAEPEPLTKPYVAAGGSSAASDPRYTVTASGTGPFTVTVRRASNNQVVWSTSTSRTRWGFSPDQDRFVLWGVTGGMFEATLYDLTDANPASTPVWSTSTAEHDIRIGFSPHGEFFAISAFQTASSDTVNLKVLDARIGTVRLQSSFAFGITDPGLDDDDEQQDFQGAGWGFSPDDDEFVYAYASGAGVVNLAVVDLDTGQHRFNGNVGGQSNWWFSPRGDVLARITQTGDALIDVVLLGTHRNSHVIASTSFTVAETDVLGFEATATHHVLHLGTNTHVLATNQPPSPDHCAPTWSQGAALTAGQATSTTVPLTWGQAVDDVAVTAYRVFRGTTQIAEIDAATLEHEVTGLSPSTTYTFSVRAGDAAGHWSEPLQTTVQTATAAPYWPAGAEITVSDDTGTSVRLSWPAAEDDGTVGKYRLLRDGTQVVETTQTAHTVTGLTRGAGHTFSVVAIDDASLESPVPLSRWVVTSTLEETSTSTVSGRLFLDHDENGADEGGPGLATDNTGHWNQWLHLMFYRVDPDGLIREGRMAVADADGEYTMADLTPGRWVVLLDAFHGGAGVYPACRRLPTNRSDRAPWILTVGEGSGWRGADYGLSDCKPENAVQYPWGSETLEAHVFEDLDLDGVKGAGESGVPGLTVNCWGLGVRRVQWDDPFCEGTTDAAGNVAIGGVPAGYKVLQIDLASRVVEVDGVVTERWYVTDDWRDGARVTGTNLGWHGAGHHLHVADSGVLPTAQLGAVRGQSTVSGSFWWDKDSDGVRDPGEPDLPAWATASVQVSSQRWTDLPLGWWTHESDPQGAAWSIEHLPPGDFTLQVDTGQFRLTTPPVESVTVASNGQTVAVPPIGVDAELGVVEGVVWDDRDGDGVKDAGEPVRPGVYLRAQVPSEEGATLLVTDELGRYSHRAQAGQTFQIAPDDWSQTLTTPQPIPDITLGDDEVRVLDFGFGAGGDTDPEVPPAPVGLRALPVDRGVRLAWSPGTVTADHGSPDRYVVESRRGSGAWTTARTVPAGTRSVTLTGLALRTRYSFRVVARNDDGDSSPSAAAGITPDARPGRPAGVTAKAARRAVTVRWRPGALTARTGRPRWFVVQVKSGRRWVTRKTVSASKRSVRIGGLTAGRRQTFRVVARNALGPGPASRTVRATPRR